MYQSANCVTLDIDQPVIRRKETSDIFREHGPAYRQTHPLPQYYKNVMRDIVTCRTEYFGSRIDKCDSCGFERTSYNSCKNRHCPKCQTIAKEKWLENRKSELLPVGYFHNVFTLPHQLNPIAQYNQQLIYDLLFASISATLKKFGLDPKHIGGKLGFIAILHTWDQLIKDHIHLHVIVPDGALSLDGSKWLWPKKKKKKKRNTRKKKKDYLFPVLALSPVFRGIFIELLKLAHAENLLNLSGKIEYLNSSEEFEKFIKKLWSPNWVVYSKEPFTGPEKVLEYLGRYTHKVAISNYRILEAENGMVTFKYRDRKDGDIEKTTSITAEEFIRRFLLHILPSGFMRIRYFGFLSNRNKKENVEKIKKYLGSTLALPKRKDETAVEAIKRLTGIDLTTCPACKTGKMSLFKEMDGLSPRCLAIRRNRNRKKFITNSS